MPTVIANNLARVDFATVRFTGEGLALRLITEKLTTVQILTAVGDAAEAAFSLMRTMQVGAPRTVTTGPIEVSFDMPPRPGTLFCDPDHVGATVSRTVRYIRDKVSIQWPVTAYRRGVLAVTGLSHAFEVAYWRTLISRNLASGSGGYEAQAALTEKRAELDAQWTKLHDLAPIAFMCATDALVLWDGLLFARSPGLAPVLANYYTRVDRSVLPAEAIPYLAEMASLKDDLADVVAAASNTDPTLDQTATLHKIEQIDNLAGLSSMFGVGSSWVRVLNAETPVVIENQDAVDIIKHDFRGLMMYLLETAAITRRCQPNQPLTMAVQGLTTLLNRLKGTSAIALSSVNTIQGKLERDLGLPMQFHNLLRINVLATASGEGAVLRAVAMNQSVAAVGPLLEAWGAAWTEVDPTPLGGAGDECDYVRARILELRAASPAVRAAYGRAYQAYLALCVMAAGTTLGTVTLGSSSATIAADASAGACLLSMYVSRDKDAVVIQ